MSRSAKTRKMLASSLKKLMQSHEYGKIHISMITDGCGKNRKSFYYHFADKEELVNWILDSEFKEYLESTPEEEQGWDVMVMLAKYLYSERAFYRSILSMEMGMIASGHFTSIVSPVMASYLKDILDVRYDEGLINFTTDAFVAAFCRWLSSPNPPSPDIFIDNLKALMIKLSERCLRRFR